jgi:hypothetical protein
MYLLYPDNSEYYFQPVQATEKQNTFNSYIIFETTCTLIFTEKQLQTKNLCI